MSIYKERSIKSRLKTAARLKVVILESSFSPTRGSSRVLSSSLKVAVLSQKRVRHVSLQCGAHFSPEDVAV